MTQYELQSIAQDICDTDSEEELGGEDTPEDEIIGEDECPSEQEESDSEVAVIKESASDSDSNDDMRTLGVVEEKISMLARTKQLLGIEVTL